MESETPASDMRGETLVKLEKEMADLSTGAAATVPSIDENLPPSDDVTANADEKESGAASSEEKTKRKKKKNKKKKSKKAPAPVDEETKEEDKKHDDYEEKVPKTVKKQVQQRDKKREDELEKFNEWADYFSSVYMAYLDKLMAIDNRIFRVDYDKAVSCAKSILQHEEARLMCAEKISELTKQKYYFICTFCNKLFLNYKQFFIHSLDESHIAEEKNVALKEVGQIASMSHTIMKDHCTKWRHEEARFEAEIAEKYASVKLDDSRLAPIKLIHDKIHKKYGKLMHSRPPNFGIADFGSPFKMMGWFPKMFKDEFADRLMTELHEQIGTKLTYCSLCSVVTGTREEYYKHLLLFKHVHDLDQASTAYFPTYAVNLHKNDLAD